MLSATDDPVLPCRRYIKSILISAGEQMPKERYIRASDIGTHAFCARALHLKDVGAPTTLVSEQQLGTAYHEAHGAAVQSSARTRKLSTWMIVAAVILLAAALLLAR